MEAINRPSSRLDAGLNRPSVRPLDAPARPIKLTTQLSFPPSVREPSSIPPKFSVSRARWTLRTCATRSPGYTAAVGTLPLYLSSRFGRNRAHHRRFSLPVCLARGHAARSFPGRCEHLQRDHGIAPMLPMSLIVKLGRSNAEFEPPEGEEMAPPRGHRSDVLPALSFYPIAFASSRWSPW